MRPRFFYSALRAARAAWQFPNRKKSLIMLIRVEGVRKRFRGRRGPVLALDGIDLDIEEGEFVCLVGPSGCGKSTLCNMIAGFDRPTEGSISMGEKVITRPSMERTMMFQEHALFPWLSAQGNVEFGLKSLNLAPRERAERARQYLHMVHLEQFAHAQPHELSGGMRQRVALARALAVEPRVLLMDEPFAALDAQRRDYLHGELQDLWRATRKTIVFVTHNVREAVVLATRIVVFTAQPGRIKAQFDLEELEYPRRATQTMVTEMVSKVSAALQDEVAKVEATERDRGGAR